MLALSVPVSMPSVVTTVEAATVKLNKKKATLYVGETLQLKLKGTKKTVKWSSSNKKIATVSSKGKVKAEKKGTATITAKVGNKKYTCKLTVKNCTLELKYHSGTEIILGKQEYYWDEIKTNAKTIIAKSSDSKVAQVVYENTKDYKGDDWKCITIYGVQPGIATITIEAGETKKKVTVTVKESEEHIEYEEFNWKEDDGYTNFIDWSIEHYKTEGKTYIVTFKDELEKVEIESNRGIILGSTSNEVIEAYRKTQAFDCLTSWDEVREALLTLHYIEPETGLHFYKFFVLGEMGTSDEDKVGEIVWYCWEPVSY